MDLFPQLQAFLVVARLRSFSAAARELGVSCSAVTYVLPSSRSGETCRSSGSMIVRSSSP